MIRQPQSKSESSTSSPQKPVDLKKYKDDPLMQQLQRDLDEYKKTYKTKKVNAKKAKEAKEEKFVAKHKVKCPIKFIINFLVRLICQL